jgi:hypothetical protein
LHEAIGLIPPHAVLVADDPHADVLGHTKRHRTDATVNGTCEVVQPGAREVDHRIAGSHVNLQGADVEFRQV